MDSPALSLDTCINGRNASPCDQVLNFCRNRCFLQLGIPGTLIGIVPSSEGEANLRKRNAMTENTATKKDAAETSDEAGGDPTL